MSSYAFRDASGDVVVFAPEFARPIPLHAQTPEALAAVESVRVLGRASRMTRTAGALVTDHGRPRLEPYAGPVPANARKLQALATRHGFEIRVVALIDGVRIEGAHAQRRCGFRATFTRGKADGASWHEPYRYAIVHDERPVGVNAKTRTSLAGKRAAGVGEIRLALVGTPRGFPITHTELTERIPA